MFVHWGVVYAYSYMSKSLTRFLGVVGAVISPTSAAVYVVGRCWCGACAAGDGGSRVVLGGVRHFEFGL